MSSSRRARRRRRHERHGKPSYSSRWPRSLSPNRVIIDEWTSPHLGEDRLRVITSEMIDWERSFISCGVMTPALTSRKKEPIRYFRTKYFTD